MFENWGPYFYPHVGLLRVFYRSLNTYLYPEDFFSYLAFFYYVLCCSALLWTGSVQLGHKHLALFEGHSLGAMTAKWCFLLVYGLQLFGAWRLLGGQCFSIFYEALMKKCYESLSSGNSSDSKSIVDCIRYVFSPRVKEGNQQWWFKVSMSRKFIESSVWRG